MTVNWYICVSGALGLGLDVGASCFTTCLCNGNIGLSQRHHKPQKDEETCVRRETNKALERIQEEVITPVMQMS